MEEKKEIKISLGTVICIVIIVMLLCALAFVYYLGFVKEDSKEIAKTQDNEIIFKEENNTEIIKEEYKVLTEQEKKDLFASITKEPALIQEMTMIKNYNEKEFSDKEILLLLPLLDSEKIFSNYDANNGFYVEAAIEDVQKISKKFFNKEVDINAFKENNDNSIKISNNNIIIEVNSGYGIVNYDLISVETVGENEYKVEFKYVSDTTSIYEITVNYQDKNIIYKSFEKKDIVGNTYDWSVVNTSKIVNKEQGYTYSTTYNTPAISNYVISNDKKTITIEADKKVNLPKEVKEVCLHYLGQGSLDFYVFLYKDGTVSYTVDYGDNIKDFKSLKNIIKLFPLEYSRKVEWDNGEMVDLVESTIVAIDNSGNIYDLGLMRNK